MRAQCGVNNRIVSNKYFFQASCAYTACANPALSIEDNSNCKCQAATTADHFPARTKITQSDAQEFAAAHCDLVYAKIHFDGAVNDATKFQ